MCKRPLTRPSNNRAVIGIRLVCYDLINHYHDFCRGGDDTKKGLNADPPLHSLVAAIQTWSSISQHAFDVPALMARPCADSAFFIIPDEHT